MQVEVNQPSKQPDASTRNQPRLSWPQVSLVALGLIAVLGSSGLTLHWKLTQQALEREGNLALIERLRNNQTPETENDQRKRTEKSSSKAPVNGALEEPAIENELRDSALPKTTTLEPITIPLPSEISSRASVADQSSAVAPQPLLMGVVHGGNGNGAAIFQLGDLSLTTVPGELIGNSGWSLRSVSTTGAVIERAGATQSLSVGGAF